MPYTLPQAFNLLRQARANHRLPHALLICGKAQAGTHDLALQMVQELNGATASHLEELRHPSCLMIRPASKSRSILINNIREIEPFLSLKAEEGQHKIVIIVEAERMKEEAANAFLKTLEEPPPNTLLILITEQADHLLPTILSRCIRMDLRSAKQELELNPVQEAFLPKIQEAFAKFNSDITALSLRYHFQALLAECREKITKELTLSLKEESKHIAEGTGLNNWESLQKDNITALIETEYLATRESLLELLSITLGQALLQASQAPDLSPLFPEIEKVAQEIPLQNLLIRMQSVDALRRDLNYNINEALALDVRMLEIVGEYPL